MPRYVSPKARSIWLMAGLLLINQGIGLKKVLAGGAFSLPEQGAYALGSAYAGVGAGSAGLPSMYWNPATITGNPGWHSSLGATGVFPFVNINPTEGTDPSVLPLGGTGNEGQAALLPNLYSSFQINDMVWLGLSVNSPFGLATDANYTSASQIYGRKSEVLSFDLNPVLGIRVNDWLSIGAGIQAMYFKSSLTAANTPFPGSPGNDLTADGFALGYSLGATVTPFEGTELGFGFRSSVEPKLNGDWTFDSALGPLPSGSYPIEINVPLPGMFTAGLKQKLNDRLSLLAGYEYTRWSRFDSFPVFFTTGPAAGTAFTSLAFRYDDAHYFSLGGEFKWKPNLSFVAGIGYQISPISDTVRTVRLPDNDLLWLTVGGRYSVNSKLSIDFSYAHISPASTTVKIASSANPAFLGLPYVGEVDSRANLISVGLNYRWK